VGELTSNVACRITAAYQGRNAQYDINLLNTTEVFVASASVIYPVAYTDRTVCVYVWDNTAQAWIQGADVVRPAQITVANIQANQYYWIGVWDYIAGAFTLAEWFGRFNTPEHGRFVGHVYSSPPAAAIGLPDDVLDISASAGHLLKPFVVNMTTQVWSDGAPFTSTGFCTFEPDAWHTWYWLVFFDYTTGRFY
jgi:hypothetical protein